MGGVIGFITMVFVGVLVPFAGMVYRKDLEETMGAGIISTMETCGSRAGKGQPGDSRGHDTVLAASHF